MSLKDSRLPSLRDKLEALEEKEAEKEIKEALSDDPEKETKEKKGRNYKKKR